VLFHSGPSTLSSKRTHTLGCRCGVWCLPLSELGGGRGAACVSSSMPACACCCVCGRAAISIGVQGPAAVRASPAAASVREGAPVCSPTFPPLPAFQFPIFPSLCSSCRQQLRRERRGQQRPACGGGGCCAWQWGGGRARRAGEALPACL